MSRQSSLRLVGAAGLAWGAALLWRGDALFGAVQGRGPSSGERDAIVLLGARHLGQGVGQVLLPRHLATLYAVVDLLHATSMVPVAVTGPQRRRAALVSGGVATLSAICCLGARA